MLLKFQNLFKNKSYWAVVILAFSFSIDSILRFLQQLVLRIPFINIFSDYVVIIFFTFLTIQIIPLIKKISIYNFLFLLVFFLLLTLSAFSYEENFYYVTLFFPTIISLCLFYLLGFLIKIDKISLQIIFIISTLAILINVFYLFYYYATGRNLGLNSMYESYSILFNGMIILWTAYKKINFFNGFLSLLTVFFLLAMGTRGPILIYLSFGLLLFSYSFITSKSKSKFIFILIFLTLLVFFTTGIYNFVLIFLRDILSSLNLSTRIIDSILEGSSQDSIIERFQIYTILWDNLLLKPFTGYGLFGEYPFIGWSAHNMYIQLLFELGIPFGVLTFTVFVIKYIYKFNHSNILEKEFLILWFCYIFIQGFFGGNILSNYVFFTIGFIFNKNRESIYK
jgi:hypothetical protein